jgi:hypothetical protein
MNPWKAMIMEAEKVSVERRHAAVAGFLEKKLFNNFEQSLKRTCLVKKQQCNQHCGPCENIWTISRVNSFERAANRAY